MIAALYVADGGVYFNLPDVDPWPASRDARLYKGPYAVVAHPPCERWGRYWGGGPMLHGTPRQKTLGDDGGCFEAALQAVRRFGGVLEHPEASHAWAHFGITKPPKSGGWVLAGPRLSGAWQDWTCCVEQGHYGHPARKATWLYAVGCELPDLQWGPAPGKNRLEPGFHSKEERRSAGAPERLVKRISARDRIATPTPFRDMLIAMARSVRA